MEGADLLRGYGIKRWSALGRSPRRDPFRAGSGANGRPRCRVLVQKVADSAENPLCRYSAMNISHSFVKPSMPWSILSSPPPNKIATGSTSAASVNTVRITCSPTSAKRCNSSSEAVPPARETLSPARTP